jgi:transcription antitermination protein NusB
MKSRRDAREGALQALYEIEVGKVPSEEAFERMVAETELSHDLEEYARRVVDGVLEHRSEIDERIAGYLRDYDFSRLAAVDRNILRIGAFEILFVPEMPPAVTLNEAIEVAKRFSTAESGKFVNGVLAGLLRNSPKAEWDPASAPPEEPIVRTPEPVIEEEIVQEDSEEAQDARRFGAWRIRGDESGEGDEGSEEA